jgi:hypothetical protein
MNLPRRLLTVKAELHDALINRDPALVAMTSGAGGGYTAPMIGERVNTLLDKWARSLEVSENLAITAAIGQVITTAGEDLPDTFVPYHHHLFAEHGFVYLESPIHDEGYPAPIRALSWHAGSGYVTDLDAVAAGLEINLWIAPADDKDVVLFVDGHGKPAHLTTPLVPAGSDFMAWGREPRGWVDLPPGVPVPERKVSAVSRFVLTLQAFLRDELPARHTMPLPRSMRPRFRRQGMPETGVTIIDLRRRAYKAREDDGEGSWSLTKRHVVRGHWHGYWVGPNHALHPGGTTDKVLVHVYLMPYVKGPEDADFAMTERVHIARR